MLRYAELYKPVDSYETAACDPEVNDITLRIEFGAPRVIELRAPRVEPSFPTIQREPHLSTQSHNPTVPTAHGGAASPSHRGTCTAGHRDKEETAETFLTAGLLDSEEETAAIFPRAGWMEETFLAAGWLGRAEADNTDGDSRNDIFEETKHKHFRFTCDKCDYASSNSQSLQVHRLNKHNIVYELHLCKTQFQYEVTLASHKLA